MGNCRPLVPTTTRASGYTTVFGFPTRLAKTRQRPAGGHSSIIEHCAPRGRFFAPPPFWPLPSVRTVAPAASGCCPPPRCHFFAETWHRSGVWYGGETRKQLDSPVSRGRKRQNPRSAFSEGVSRGFATVPNSGSVPSKPRNVVAGGTRGEAWALSGMLCAVAAWRRWRKETQWGIRSGSSMRLTCISARLSVGCGRSLRGGPIG